MARARIFAAAVTMAAVCFSIVPLAIAQPEHLEDHIWVGGTGNQQWQVDANWDPPTFPNDPGRQDTNRQVITDSIGANLSVNLPANLNVNVGATDITIAALTIGSASSPVTTNVTSSGGRLVFENFELNDDTNPDDVICAFNCGNALITSQGVPGVTNVISAVVGVNDRLEIAGTRDITLSGGVQEIGTAASLRAITPGQTVFVTGNINLINQPPDDGTVDAPFGLNDSNVSQGTLDVSGVIQGPDSPRLFIGSPQAGSVLPRGTVILRGVNTYGGRTFLGRGNVVLANNSALGTGVVAQSGPAQVVGYNILSNNDNRVISNDMAFSQFQTVRGEHSLEWAGAVWQDNARGWINLLPDGKILTLSGPQYPNRRGERPPVPGRVMIFDGTGRTVVTGGIHNELDDIPDVPATEVPHFIGGIRKRGTGAMLITGGNSTYSGDTIVEGGNLHFATNSDLGSSAQIVSTGGAVGVDAGVVNNATFLGRLNNANNPQPDLAGNPVVWDRGGLMLGTTEYGQNLNFTTGALANAANMSLAAHETGSTYTGTITPVNNTYRLGGGRGTLILPNANQLTGANSLRAENGGEVVLSSTNNYTGSTTLVAKYHDSGQEIAAADTGDYRNGQLYIGTTLTASSLANGGAASSIGSSSNAAGNLFIQGSTLKYVGPATSTNRLFTIGTGGATIDASGSGALNFTNGGALAVDVAEQRTGNVNAFATGNTANDQITIRNLPTTEDLQPGMPIMSPNVSSSGIPPDTVIARILSPTDVQISNPIGFTFSNNTLITFGPAPERTLTLTGSNTGNNTLAAVIPNASDGGVVGVTKTGPGKWILTGNNTYTGDTVVEQGVLSITNRYLADSSTVHMTSGGVLDLNFTGIDDVNQLFFNGIEQGAGLWGAAGNTSADFTSSFFTGMGLLRVLTGEAPEGLPGDYNNDGKVDAADYVLWRKNNINGQDGYNVWRANFGAMAGSGAAASGLTAATSVPEPTAAALAMLALAMFIGCSQKFARRRETALLSH